MGFFFLYKMSRGRIWDNFWHKMSRGRIWGTFYTPWAAAGFGALSTHHKQGQDLGHFLHTMSRGRIWGTFYTPWAGVGFGAPSTHHEQDLGHFFFYTRWSWTWTGFGGTFLHIMSRGRIWDTFFFFTQDEQGQDLGHFSTHHEQGQDWWHFPYTRWVGTGFGALFLHKMSRGRIWGTFLHIMSKGRIGSTFLHNTNRGRSREGIFPFFFFLFFEKSSSPDATRHAKCPATPLAHLWYHDARWRSCAGRQGPPRSVACTCAPLFLSVVRTASADPVLSPVKCSQRMITWDEMLLRTLFVAKMKQGNLHYNRPRQDKIFDDDNNNLYL